MRHVGFWGASISLIGGCSSEPSGTAAPGDGGTLRDGSSGSVSAGGSAGGISGSGGGGTAGSGGAQTSGGAGASGAAGGASGFTSSGGAGGAIGGRCTKNQDCDPGYACYTGLSVSAANGYCARRTATVCDPASGGCPCLEITIRDDHSCEGILGAYCTGTDDPSASWYCAVPP